AKLKVMTGHTFVDTDRSWVLRRRAPEITEIARRLSHIADAIVFQPRWRSKIVGLTEPLQRAQVFRHFSQRVMLEPIRHSQDSMVLEKFSDRQFLCRGGFDLARAILRQLEWRHVDIRFFSYVSNATTRFHSWFPI